jgi:Dolichyl-phosphate-mannose-protein mannosyltransferase
MLPLRPELEPQAQSPEPVAQVWSPAAIRSRAVASPAARRDWGRWLSRWGSAAIAISWFVFGALNVGRYGISIDTPALFYSGDRTLYWLEHPATPKVLDLGGSDPAGFASPYGRVPAFDDPFHYPVFPSFLAAVSAKLFHGELHWLSDIDARNLGLVGLHCVGLWLFGLYACALFGPRVGLASALALALYPSAIGNAFSNPKDWPSALYYGVALLAGGLALERRSPRTLLACGALFGLSLSSKLNGAFGLATFFLWTPLAYALLIRRRHPITPGLLTAFFALPYVALGVFILSWPWLWTGPSISDLITRTGDYFTFLANFGMGGRTTWTSYPLRCLIGYTPPVLLGLATLGLVFAPKGAPKTLARWLLVLLWFGIVLIRIAAPHSNFYDGNRHFLEYIPALAVLVGLGFDWCVRILSRPQMATWLAPAFGAACLAAALVPLLAYHPYEVAYFSPLVHGLGGAQRTSLLYEGPPQDWRVAQTEGDYWFSGVRDAISDLKKVIKPRDTVGLCGPWTTQFDPAWPEPGRPHLADADSATWVIAEYRACDSLQALERKRPLVFRVSREGGLIYEILGPAPPEARAR